MKRVLSTIVVIVGLVMLLHATTALASPGSSLAPDYAVWFQILLGAVMLLIGGYAKGVSDRLTNAERKIDANHSLFVQHQLDMANHAQTKQGAESHYAELRGEIRAVHARLDKWHVPSAFIGPSN